MNAASQPNFDSRNACINYLVDTCNFNRKALRGMPFGKLQQLALDHWNARN
jgi:hypothetical protein